MYDYQQQGALFSWIKKIPPEDRNWARDYLLRKSIYPLTNEFEPSAPAFAIPNNAQNREIDSQLRNAWRQRKARRKRSGRKAYNFVLSDSAKRKLDQIAESMFSSITDALNNVLDNEHQRIEEHKQKRKELKKEDARLKKFSKSLQHTHTVTAVLRATESALLLQTMKLALAQVRLERPLVQHAPQDLLKEDTLKKFQSLLQGIKASMGVLSQGLPTIYIDNEMLWQKVTSEGLDTPEEATRALL